MKATDSEPTIFAGEFTPLTQRQTAVLDLLAQGRTTKEIAGKLDLSESAVNRRIELLRNRFGGITRLELARRYRDRPADFAVRAEPEGGGVETGRQSLHLADLPGSGEKQAQDDLAAGLVFRDSLEMSIEAPWSGAKEPRVVPGVLDGRNAWLTRGAAIAIILLAIIASLVLGLAAAQAITDALGG